MRFVLILLCTKSRRLNYLNMLLNKRIKDTVLNTFIEILRCYHTTSSVKKKYANNKQRVTGTRKQESEEKTMTRSLNLLLIVYAFLFDS
jgi:hypothetical protein